jgi:hypothetical protein
MKLEDIDHTVLDAAILRVCRREQERDAQGATLEKQERIANALFTSAELREWVELHLKAGMRDRTPVMILLWSAMAVGIEIGLALTETDA